LNARLTHFIANPSRRGQILPEPPRHVEAPHQAHADKARAAPSLLDELAAHRLREDATAPAAACFRHRSLRFDAIKAPLRRGF
jgi:hypothetical protein